MPEKKNAFPTGATDGEGHKEKELGDNLHSSSGNVKSAFDERSQEDSDRKYGIDTLLRYQILDHAQFVVVEAFPQFWNKNFAKCYRVTFASSVPIMRNPETRRAYAHGVITCANPLLCPVCAPRIMGMRGFEISSAVDQWLNESSENTCFLITLTCQHNRNSRLNDLLIRSAAARKDFWESGTLNRFLKKMGRIGRITALEIQTSEEAGFHPHQHILIFCKKCDLDVEFFKDLWTSSADGAGLFASKENGLTIFEARSAATYLAKSKISCELALGNCKQGRAGGRFSPIELMNEMMFGSTWAKERFLEMFLATRGLHVLYWSPGLKSRFQIAEHSDEDIASGKVSTGLQHFIEPYSEGWRSLTIPEKALLFKYSGVGDWDRAFAMLEKRGIKIIVPGVAL